MSSPIRQRRRAAAVVLATLAAIASACSGPLDGVALTDQTSEESSTTGIEQESADGEESETSVEQESDPDPDSDTEGDSADRPPAPPIHVDQFGYLPGDRKVAVLAAPEVGFNSDDDYEPGDVIELRRVDDDSVVASGRPEPWSNGDLHEQSGDRGWWFDFSDVTAEGTYYVIDVESDVRTGPFDVSDDIYDELLDAALKMFWYNRANTPHPESLAGPWSDDAAYAGEGQDVSAYWVDDRTNDDTVRDLSGGWFDAGDTNKYVTFASEPVHLLLTAYREHPRVFGDDVGIPESANGIPDVVDEVKWEIDWLEKMQEDDGGVLTKVGLLGFGSPEPPSSSELRRYYEEACSSSTIVAAGMFAHAAIVFSAFPELSDDADRLRERAIQAWDWYQANDKSASCDPQIVQAGDADLTLEEQSNHEVVAAIYLFGLTGSSTYSSVVSNGFDEMVPFGGDGFGDYSPDQADALRYYSSLPGANGATARGIQNRISTLTARSPLFGFEPDADLYRAFMSGDSYHWGSNRVKANVGAANLVVGNVPGGRERALSHLHYFHGVNPLGLVYLSNMYEFGAERSAETLFHFWFGPNTMYDVDRGSEDGAAPGYVVGGPNQFYTGRNAPPAGQPPQKSYLDRSVYNDEPAWEISEPAIYYQAAYLRLLAAVLER